MAEQHIEINEIGKNKTLFYLFYLIYGYFHTVMIIFCMNRTCYTLFSKNITCFTDGYDWQALLSNKVQNCFLGRHKTKIFSQMRSLKISRLTDEGPSNNTPNVPVVTHIASYLTEFIQLF